MAVFNRLGKICEKPMDGLMYIWLVTIATMVGLGFAAAGAFLFFPAK